MKNTKLFMFAACTLFLAACGKQTVKIMTPPDASNRILFSAEQLQTTLDKAGYQVMMQQGDTTFSDPEIKTILLTEVNDTTLKKEGFHITTTGNLTRVSGRDGSGVIYGCRELIDRVNDSEGKLNFPEYTDTHTHRVPAGKSSSADRHKRRGAPFPDHLSTLPESQACHQSRSHGLSVRDFRRSLRFRLCRILLSDCR